MKKVRNEYYRERNICNTNKETRVLLRVLTREIEVEIAKYKFSKWQKFLAEVQETDENTDRAFWLHVSRVYKQKPLSFSELDTGKTILSKENEISGELFQYYSEQFKAQNVDMSDPHEVQIEIEHLEFTNKLALLNEKVKLTTVTEIKKYISKLKPKKSSGFDAVSNYMIKRVSAGYISCLTKCFNTWLSEYRYPNFWKLAKIITLNKLKAGVRRCDQTRPISFLATHSKLFQKIILERVRYWAESNKLVPVEQSGFRQGCLLPTRVLSIYQEIKNNMTANIPTLGVYCLWRE